VLPVGIATVIAAVISVAIVTMIATVIAIVIAVALAVMAIAVMVMAGMPVATPVVVVVDARDDDITRIRVTVVIRPRAARRIIERVVTVVAVVIERVVPVSGTVYAVARTVLWICGAPATAGRAVVR
jgi:hypothetical protein